MPSCSFCKADIETIDYLVYECYFVEELWCDLKECVFNEFDNSIIFDQKKPSNILLIFKISSLYTKHFTTHGVNQYNFAYK